MLARHSGSKLSSVGHENNASEGDDNRTSSNRERSNERNMMFLDIARGLCYS